MPLGLTIRGGFLFFGTGPIWAVFSLIGIRALCTVWFSFIRPGFEGKTNLKIRIDLFSIQHTSVIATKYLEKQCAVTQTAKATNFYRGYKLTSPCFRRSRDLGIKLNLISFSRYNDGKRFLSNWMVFFYIVGRLNWSAYHCPSLQCPASTYVWRPQGA